MLCYFSIVHDIFAAIDVGFTRISANVTGLTVADLSVQLVSLHSTPWSDSDRVEILKIINAPETVSLRSLGLVNRMIADRIAVAVSRAITEAGLSPKDVDLIASHGLGCY